jgi:hypothetical protein
LISRLLDIKIKARLDKVVDSTAKCAKTKSAKLGLYRKGDYAS